MLVNAALGLAGEAGEFADLVKKIQFQGKPMDDVARARLIDEAGDVLWYLALAAETLGVSFGYIATVNLNKLGSRYPDGSFSEERSNDR